jgi:hypothetical protein
MDFHQNIYTGEKIKLFPPNYNSEIQYSNLQQRKEPKYI